MIQSSWTPNRRGWRVVVTYFKCVSCKARLYSAAEPDSLVRDLCPGCGATLDPIGALAEVVGYRSISLRDVVRAVNEPPAAGGP